MSAEDMAQDIYHLAAQRIMHLPSAAERLAVWQALQDRIEDATALETDIRAHARAGGY